MKRSLLVLTMALASLAFNAQVIFNVTFPSVIGGTYNFEYADSTSWGVSDLTDPINSVTDTLVLAYDNTAADSLCCSSILNSAEVNGKIAVLYRGDCQFGLKALNAQNAGAVAVIIINNDGEAVGMLGGDNGMGVTIPVVMIGETDGVVITDAIRNGTVVAFLGSKLGYYDNDINMYASGVMRAKQFSNVQRVCQDSTEFTVEVGAWMFNFGANKQTGISLSADIVLNGTTIYSEVSDTFSLASGDSNFISLKHFAQGSYAVGYYHMNYTIASDSTDQDMSDNVINSDFMISESQISYAPIDSTTLRPISSGHYRTVSRGLNGDEQLFCIHYQDPNASRLGVVGMYFSAVRSSDIGSTLDSEGDAVNIYAYEWTETFTGLADFDNNPSLGITLNEISSGEYAFASDLQDSSIYVPFFQNFALVDNQRYLFCLSAFSDTVYYGMNGNIDYTANQTEIGSPTFDQPVTLVFGEASDGSMAWFLHGFGEDLVPSLGIETIDGATVGITEEQIEESKITPYPNPASSLLSIPLKGIAKNSAITIYDMAGKLVATKSVNSASGSIVNVDVADIANGAYMFTVNLENGTTTSFKVLVSK